ncbi:MAG: hypothetical protein WA971_09300, partial [Microbacterium sp.]
TYGSAGSYAPGARPGEDYALAVVAADGSTTTLSTWLAEPGVTARVSAVTALPLTGIRAIEVRDADDRVVLQHDFR